MEITKAHFTSVLHYNPDTGVFTWLQKMSNNVAAGSVAGTIHHAGYRVIGICGKTYGAHRLAFLYVEGSLPSHEVDHINGVRDDNRWSNLRAVTVMENRRNAKQQSRNKSGVCGVHWYKQTSRWQAQINDANKRIHLGFFLKKEDAIAARKSAEKHYGYQENHGRVTP